jgi:hypothetical protein
MSNHFAVGSWVCWFEDGPWGARRKRAEVISRPGNGFMLVRHDDQTTEILYPQALAYESKDR